MILIVLLTYALQNINANTSMSQHILSQINADVTTNQYNATSHLAGGES